jgi:hypothetical protein
MPTDTAIVVTILVIVFAIFAVAMIWADIYTRDSRAPGAKYFDGREKKV